MRARPHGIEIAYTDEGEGLPLLFVHGFPLCRRAWAHQVAAFSPDYRVLAPDLRGLGESALGPGEPEIATYAADLVELVRHLEAGPVLLVGHSMGGYVALAFALAHPELLRGLVLVATRSGADSAEVAAGRLATAEKVLAEGVQGLAEGMVPKMLAPGADDPALRSEVLSLMAPPSPEGVAAALRAMAARPDATPSLGAIQAPTLVVTGDADTLIPPSESEKLAAAIPHASLVTIPGAGHLVAYERPEAFNRALGDWVAATRLP